MKIPLSNVHLTPAAYQNVYDALARNWISGTGDYVTQFERALAVQVSRQHAIAVSNGTVALEVALKALGIGPGDEVIVPALTFVAPAAAVRSVGAKPILVDVTEESWTLDCEKLQQHLTLATAAVIAVDLLGHPADYEWLKIAMLLPYDVEIPIIEDAAEAHGAIYFRDIRRIVGSIGRVSTFSFHANKTITTGEGGAITTDLPGLAARIRLIANHGMTHERPYYHEVVGTNARMTNLTAAIGTAQVAAWDDLVMMRNQVARKYDERLVDLFDNTELYRRPVASWATEACWLYTVAHPNREPIINALRAKGIDSRAIWPALCDLQLYRESCRGDYPVARKISREAFWLPTWAGMPDSDIDFICEVLYEAIQQPIHE